VFEILAVASEYCVDSGGGGVTPEALTPLVSSLRGVSLCSESLSYFHTTLCGFFSPVPRLDCFQLLEKDYSVRTIQYYRPIQCCATVTSIISPNGIGGGAQCPLVQVGCEPVD
jgi:hypothetical protein